MTDIDAVSREVARALVRFNSRVMGLTMAVVAALAVFLATIVLLLHGGESPGPMLAMLGSFFPGYSVSVKGALVGALWAAVVFYLVGVGFGRAYGLRVLLQVRRGGSLLDPDADLGQAVALLAPLSVAVTAGGLLAIGLFAAHHWLALRPSTPAEHLTYLGLLASYLPGYRVDLAGSFVGAFWIFLYGFVGAGSTAWLYNRVARARHRP